MAYSYLRLPIFFLFQSANLGAGDGDRTRNFQLGKLTLYH